MRRAFIEKYKPWTKQGKNIDELVVAPVEVEARADAMQRPHTAAVDGENDFDVNELLCHVESQALLNTGTAKAFNNFVTI